MSRTTRSIFFVIAFAFAGCSNNNGSQPADAPAGGFVVGGDSGGGRDSGTSDGARAPFANGVSTLAGGSDAGDVDGGRDVNLFNNPVNVVLTSAGIVIVADFYNGKLRAVDAAGNATTVIDDPTFSRPFGMALAADGTLFVSTDNDPNGNHSLMSGTVWSVDLSSQTATPIAVGIGRPRGLAALADGRIAAADDLHNVIELIDPHTGAVTTLAGAWDLGGFAQGAGAAARFSTPVRPRAAR